MESPAPGEASKLLLFNTDIDFSNSGVFSLLSVFTGFVLLNIAAFGLDQDMTQRVLTCRNAKEGSKAMLLSVVMVIPVMCLFLIIGLLLYVYYQRPDLMSSLGGDEPVPTFAGKPVTIFMYYVLNEIPDGVRGLVTVGILAAALSTLNSGLNSMSSVLIQDMYRPWLERRKQKRNDSHFVKAGRIAMAFMALALGSMACLCFYWQQYTNTPLLQFALGVMVFSYSGLLGVYFITLFTERGSKNSVICALFAGFCVPLFMQPYVMKSVLPETWVIELGFTWQLVIGTIVSTVICALGTTRQRNQITA